MAENQLETIAENEQTDELVKAKSTTKIVQCMTHLAAAGLFFTVTPIIYEMFPVMNNEGIPYKLIKGFASGGLGIMSTFFLYIGAFLGTGAYNWCTGRTGDEEIWPTG